MSAPVEVRQLHLLAGPDPYPPPEPLLALIDDAPVGLAVVRHDDQLSVETANPAFDRLLSADPLPGAMATMSPGQTSPSPEAPRCTALAPLFDAATGGATVNPTTLRTPHGWVRLHLTRIETDRSRLLVTAVDVTDLHQALEDAEHRAGHDDLTGLPNRVTLARHVAAFLAPTDPAREGALLYGDIDDFKALNDTYGHTVGDGLLREVADRVARILPPGATFARLGGDEFAVFIPDCPLAAATESAAAIRRALLNPCLARDIPVALNMSIGTTVFDSRCAEPVDDLLHRADTAMYVVKGLRNGQRR